MTTALLSARADIDAAMARRMARGRREPHRIVEREVVVDQQRLAGRHHRLAVEAPHIAAAAGAIFAAFGRLLPCGYSPLSNTYFAFGKVGTQRRSRSAVFQPLWSMCR